jgi:putative tryptophan/tyrosine transport system substrate-binding protein
MRRREFIALMCGTATSSLAAHAQQVTPVVGILYNGTQDTFQPDLKAFRAGLAELGFVDGNNVEFEHRYADNQLDRLAALANDLVLRRVAVIFSANTAATVLAAKSATSSIPVVFSMGADAVGMGVVASLAKPGGNITGITVLAGELIGKRLELLHEIIPTVETVAYLVNTANPAFSEAALRMRAESARKLGVRLLIVDAGTSDDIDRAFEAIASNRVGALLIGPDTFFQAQRIHIITLAARYGVPASYPWPEDVSAGGLFSYGADFLDVSHKAGIYVARILNGEKPADLPVQQPTKFKLTVNLKTAKALELTVPQSILVRADEVVE